jgi:hypothetical protein
LHQKRETAFSFQLSACQKQNFVPKIDWLHHKEQKGRT